jgi:PUA domain protein
MCRGFTSPGGVIPIEPMAEGEPVAVYCEGKEHAIAIGVLKMSTDAIVSVNSGIAVECLHFLNDGLYFNSRVE